MRARQREGQRERERDRERDIGRESERARETHRVIQKDSGDKERQGEATHLSGLRRRNGGERR